MRSNVSWVMVTLRTSSLPMNRQTDTSKNITFPQLRWRPVTSQMKCHFRVRLYGSKMTAKPTSLPDGFTGNLMLTLKRDKDQRKIAFAQCKWALNIHNQIESNLISEILTFLNMLNYTTYKTTQNTLHDNNARFTLNVQMFAPYLKI